LCFTGAALVEVGAWVKTAVTSLMEQALEQDGVLHLLQPNDGSPLSSLLPLEYSRRIQVQHAAAVVTGLGCSTMPAGCVSRDTGMMG
jgi:hypothetical protein